MFIQQKSPEVMGHIAWCWTETIKWFEKWNQGAAGKLSREQLWLAVHQQSTWDQWVKFTEIPSLPLKSEIIDGYILG